MFSRIETLPEKKLIGCSIQMSFAANKTTELWKCFMSEVKQLNLPENRLLYSVEVYNDVDFFNSFDPIRIFEKWAAVEAHNLMDYSEDLQSFVLPAGLYAVFIHKGPASDGHKTYDFIFNNWIPQSDYTLANRPHIALMGSTYKNNEPDSEEEIWIPITDKSN